MSKPHSKPRTEHASDVRDGEGLEEYLTKPGAVIGRVECQHLDRDGDTIGQGQTMVSTMMLCGHYPEELLRDVPPVWLTGHVPWIETGEPPTGLGAAMLEPSAARALARLLLEAADRADPPTECVPCVCGSNVLQHCIVRWPKRGAGVVRQYHISCPCGLRSPSEPTEQAAIARWNGMMDVTP